MPASDTIRLPSRARTQRVGQAGRAGSQAGEPIVCGHDGIRVTPEFRERDRHGFAFMNNDVSPERRVESD